MIALIVDDAHKHCIHTYVRATLLDLIMRALLASKVLPTVRTTSQKNPAFTTHSHCLMLPHHRLIATAVSTTLCNVMNYSPHCLPSFSLIL